MKLQKDKIPFTQVANEVLTSSLLSWKAKGIYAYLFSKPDGWDFSGDRIKKEGLDGRFAVFAALKELEKSGYIERERLSNGKVSYRLKYSTQMTESGIGVAKPNDGNCKVQKSPSAETVSISNKESPSNKDEENNNSGASPQGFNLKKAIEDMEDHPRRDLQIIGLYFSKRMPDFRNKEQMHKAIVRHLRPAKALTPFADDQIIKGFKKAAAQTPEWTIETAVKMLTK